MVVFAKRTGLLGLAACVAIGAAGWWLLKGETRRDGAPDVALPSLTGTALAGQSLFAANCSECHGSKAQGTDNGPPLIHKIYEPGHHADETFQRAVKLGARAHHWSFGDMPRVEGVSRGDVEKILAFVRAVQRHNGIN